jgi:hypothetical protein
VINCAAVYPAVLDAADKHKVAAAIQTLIKTAQG